MIATNTHTLGAPIPVAALDLSVSVDPSQPLPCAICRTPIAGGDDDTDWGALAEAPHDDPGALDDVWVPLDAETRPYDITGKRRVGRGTVCAHHMIVEGVECVCPALQWRGRRWIVRCVFTNTDIDAQWAITHVVWDGWDGFRRALQEQPTPDWPTAAVDAAHRQVVAYWREAATLALARDAARAHGVRSTALPVPSAAGQLLPYAVPGRYTTTLKTALTRVVRITGGGVAHTMIRDGKQVAERADIHVRITLEGRRSTGHAARIVLPGKWAQMRLLPATGKESDLPGLVVAELAEVLGGRNLMPALATLGVVAARGGVSLDDHDAIPADVRLEVMRLTGCDPHIASGARKREYQRIMEYMRWAQLQVERREGKRQTVTYLPLMLASEYKDPGRQNGVRLIVNPDVMSGSVRLPLALMGVSDVIDPQGILRALGAAIVWRVAMSSAKPERLAKPESLRKVLERAGLWGWVQPELERNGPAGVMGALDRALAALRRLEWIHDGRHEVVDLIGDTRVEWGAGRGIDAIGKARVLLAVPAWMRSASTPTLPMLPGPSAR